MPKKYETIEGHKLRSKVRAIIRNDQEEFLLIQPHTYEENNWTLVGGGVENGESYEEAIRREILEETGLKNIQSLAQSQIEHWFCFSDKIKQERRLDYDGQYAKVFWVEVSSRKPVVLQEAEVRAFCWVNQEEVLKRIQIPAQKQLFMDVMAEMDFSNAKAA